MEQRISLITLAVDDLERAAAFYDAMGWQRAQTPPSLVAFDLQGQTLGLFPRDAMAAELGVDPAELRGGSGVTLSHNVRSKDEVAPVLNAAEAAGATLLNRPRETDWGGYHGHFADPDGHVWEVAFNPFSELSDEGYFRWLGYGSAGSE